ncbi:MAG: transposase [Acholeplasmataceae bacterium]|nr:transposase [Acholeplasmataceae bacterium]
MNETIKGYVYRLKPTAKQINLINQTFGCVRKIWNILLLERKSIYELYGKYPELLNSHQYMNPKYIKEQFPYMYDVDSQSLTTAWLYLKQAYTNFFNQSHDEPKYKSRHNPIQSYTTHTTNDNIRIEDTYIKLPKLGLVKMKLHRALPQGSIIKAATIKKDGKHYYVSLRVEYEPLILGEKTFEKAIGLDYTLQGLYMDSEGHQADYPNYYKESLEKLKKEQQISSRRVKGSSNYLKQKEKLASLHLHIKNQRKDFLHKASRYLVNTYDLISIETLDLTEMAKTKHFRKSIYDTSFGTFTRYLEYKAKDEGKILIKIDKYYPSTKTCSQCGRERDMLLFERTYHCMCGHKMDRDLNAAINIGVQGLIAYATKAYGTDAIAW